MDGKVHRRTHIAEHTVNNKKGAEIGAFCF